MASRNLFHVNELQDFKDWCAENQISYKPGQDPLKRQVLQVKVGTAWQVIYRNAADPEHYSIPDPLLPLIQRFHKDYK
jgi:hypothetical protein